MKRFAIVCALVLLLNVLCPVGHMHAEEIGTPTDVECTHPRKHEGGYLYDDTHHWYVCPDCGEKVDVLEHNDKCYLADVCNDCGRTDVTFGFTGHGYIDMETYSSDEYTHWNVCDDCGEKINVNYHTGTVGGDCTVCGAPYACAHVNGQYDFDDSYHWFVCDDCGENVNKEEHDAKPGDVGDNCTVCGAYVVCEHTNKSEWHYDTMTHWKECIDCGFVVDELGHDNWANCSVCGYVCAHENTEAWRNVGDEHGRDCIDCGMTVDLEKHYSDGTPGVCTVCGVSFTDCDNGIHAADYSTICSYDDENHYYPCIYCGEIAGSSIHYGGTWWYDETYHWIGCNDCSSVNKGDEKSLHSAGCNDPEVCQLCSYVGVSEDRVFHSTDYSKYVYDEKEHWYACYCGEERSSVFTHEAFCDDPNTCGTCDAVLPEPMEVDHVARYEGADGFDETSHWWYCTICGEIALKENHWAWCDWPNYCDRDECTNTTEIRHCGAMSDDDHDPETHALTCYCGDIYYDFTNYVTVKKATCSEDGIRTKRCSFCNELIEEILPATGHTWGDPVTVEPTCTTDGSVTTTCTACGEKTVETISGGHSFVYHYDNEGFHWEYCTKCQLMQNYEQHPIPEKSERYSNETECWNICPWCNAEWGRIGHVQDCMGEFCTVCEAPFVGEYVSHFIDMDEGPFVYVNEKVHELVCLNCGKNAGFPDAHTIDESKTVTVEATCAKDGSITKVCAQCEGKIVEVIPATGKHNWETTVYMAPTCTAAGHSEQTCTVCGEKQDSALAAKGHAYGLVFVTEGNGTHAKTCADCGAKYIEDCTLTSTEMGNMVCSACATCGYAVYTMADSVLEEVEGLTDAAAEIEVKRVENVSFELVIEPAEDGAETEAESAEITDVVLVVHETQLEMTVELPDTVNASVKKVLAVSMLKEGSAIQPTGKVKLSIPVVEEEVAGMKLMLMGEDGELIEIEYEIIDGVIVFETELVGIFLFVEAEA